MRLLIDAGADVNLADADGVSPLAHARQRGQGGSSGCRWPPAPNESEGERHVR